MGVDSRRGCDGVGDTDTALAFPFPLSLFLFGGGREGISTISISGELSRLRLIPVILAEGGVGEAMILVVVDGVDLLPVTLGSTFTSLMIFCRLALVTGLARV